MNRDKSVVVFLFFLLSFYIPLPKSCHSFLPSAPSPILSWRQPRGCQVCVGVLVRGDMLTCNLTASS